MGSLAVRMMLSRVLLVLLALAGPGLSSLLVVQAQSARPNIILIVTDDQDARSLEQMPNVQQQLVQKGASFANFLVSTPGCCPSRASILRGQYTHNHGVLFSDGPNGGYDTFRDLGHERSTLATWLYDAGYRTALIGKYLNGYGETGGSTPVPPGWRRWYASTSVKYFDYDLVENGRLVHYGGASGDYLTDVLADEARAFVRDAAERRTPFFLYLNPRAPHGPLWPAPRHEGLFEGVKIPRTASFNEEDVRDKPTYVRQSRALSRDEIRELDTQYRNRLRMLQAVDEMVLTLVRTLRDTGTLDTTYIFFTSDNGVLLGEHRRASKGMPYEEAIRVPLLVRGPGVPVGTVQALASNIDLAPTIAELAGVGIPGFVDGRSLAPLLGGHAGTAWRQGVLVAAFGRHDRFGILNIGDEPSPPPFKALRLQDRVYVDYPETGERELYDLRTDPLQLQNLAGDPAFAAEMDRLHAWLGALASCAGVQCHTAEESPPVTSQASVAGDQEMAPAGTDEDDEQDTNQDTDEDDEQGTDKGTDEDDEQDDEQDTEQGTDKDDKQDTNQSNGKKDNKVGKDRKE